MNGVRNSKIIEGFAPPSNFLTGSWEERTDVFLKSILQSLQSIRDVFPLLKPGTEKFHSFTNNLAEQLADYMHKNAIEAYHICSRQEQEQNKIESIFMASGIVHFAVYWLAETNYTVDEALALISPQVRASMDTMPHEMERRRRT